MRCGEAIDVKNKSLAGARPYTRAQIVRARGGQPRDIREFLLPPR